MSWDSGRNVQRLLEEANQPAAEEKLPPIKEVLIMDSKIDWDSDANATDDLGGDLESGGELNSDGGEDSADSEDYDPKENLDDALLKGVVYKINWNCPLCKTNCSAEKELRKHIIGVHIKGQIPICPICSEKFVSKFSAARHVLNLHMNVYDCKLCGQKNRWLSELKKHLVIHRSPISAKTNPLSKDDFVTLALGLKKDWICPICKVNSGSYESLETHIKDEHPLEDAENQCQLCPTKLQHRQNYVRHILYVHVKLYDCPECKKSLQSLSQLGRHFEEVHRNPDLYNSPLECADDGGFWIETPRPQIPNELFEQPFNTPVRCLYPDCPMKLESIGKLKEHFFTMHPDVSQKCFLCEFRGSRSSIVTHIINKHMKDVRLNCIHCDYVGTTPSLLRSHFGQNHNPKFCCELCGDTLESKARLDEHMNSHRDMLTCEICDYQVQSPVLFKQHMENHEATKHKCDLCDKSYRTKLHLNIHRAHHFPPEFACQKCDQVFYSKRTRDTHQQKHEWANRIYQPSCICQVCNRKFSSERRLKNHHKVVHLKPKPTKFSCKVCGKTFTRHYLLMDHANVHLPKST